MAPGGPAPHPGLDAAAGRVHVSAAGADAAAGGGARSRPRRRGGGGGKTRGRCGRSMVFLLLIVLHRAGRLSPAPGSAGQFRQPHRPPSATAASAAEATAAAGTTEPSKDDQQRRPQPERRIVPHRIALPLPLVLLRNGTDAGSVLFGRLLVHPRANGLDGFGAGLVLHPHRERSRGTLCHHAGCAVLDPVRGVGGGIAVGAGGAVLCECQPQTEHQPEFGTRGDDTKRVGRHNGNSNDTNDPGATRRSLHCPGGHDCLLFGIPRHRLLPAGPPTAAGNPRAACHERGQTGEFVDGGLFGQRHWRFGL
mmetsp:Transcript_17438/g.48159  ORF Transcript_17438/g.48159 Transcript_17438/m.48159 type:complete len:308 (-) Transcript_17438:111-1034(-)